MHRFLLGNGSWPYHRVWELVYLLFALCRCQYLLQAVLLYKMIYVSTEGAEVHDLNQGNTFLEWAGMEAM